VFFVNYYQGQKKDTCYFKHAVNMSYKLPALAPSIALPPASMRSCTRSPAGDGLK